jgi:hypothetical protein
MRQEFYRDGRQQPYTNMLADAMDKMSRLKPSNSGDQGGPDLLETSWRTRSAVCSDPRDKVFSLLSIIPPLEASIIDVDYTMSVGQVFALATYASLVKRENQDAFHYVCLGSQDSVTKSLLPTWAVDFATPCSYTWKTESVSVIPGWVLQVARARAPRLGNDISGQLGKTAENTKFTGSHAKTMRLDRRTSRLTLKGIPFDVVGKRRHSYRLCRGRRNGKTTACQGLTALPSTDRHHHYSDADRISRPKLDHVCATLAANAVPDTTSEWNGEQGPLQWNCVDLRTQAFAQVAPEKRGSAMQAYGVYMKYLEHIWEYAEFASERPCLYSTVASGCLGVGPRCNQATKSCCCERVFSLWLLDKTAVRIVLRSKGCVTSMALRRAKQTTKGGLKACWEVSICLDRCFFAFRVGYG